MIITIKMAQLKIITMMIIMVITIFLTRKKKALMIIVTQIEIRINE